ncbi:hypothetical protein MPTK2_7g11780 [Marchantia polymorpha subsp. ruderalis]
MASCPAVPSAQARPSVQIICSQNLGGWPEEQSEEEEEEEEENEESFEHLSGREWPEFSTAAALALVLKLARRAWKDHSNQNGASDFEGPRHSLSCQAKAARTSTVCTAASRLV